MFELRSILVVEFDYLLDRIAQEEVVVRLVLDFEVVRLELDFLNHLVSFDWGALFAGYDLLDWRVDNLLQIGFVVGNQLFGPLPAILDVIDHLDLVQQGTLQSL